MTSRTGSTPMASVPVKTPVKRLTIEDILGQYWEYNVANDLGTYGYPIIIFLGTVGNILTFLVMIRPGMRRSSTCFYMGALAICDTLVLYFACFRQWITVLQDTDGLNLSSSSCKTLNFLSYTCFDIAVWILVAMTTERFVVVRFPLKATKVATIPRARTVLCLLIVLFIGFNLHFFWTVDLDDRSYCKYVDDHEDFHNDVWPWMDAVVYSFAPFTMLLIFNIAIIYHTRRSLINRRSTLHVQRMHPRQIGISAQNRLTTMLVTVSVVFLLLSAPNVVLISIRDEYFNFSTTGLPDFHDVAVYRLVATVTNICLYLNHAVNFLLYCISGQRFRRELWLLFKCQWTLRQTRSRTFSDLTTRSHRLSESSAPASPNAYRRTEENHM